MKDKKYTISVLVYNCNQVDNWSDFIDSLRNQQLEELEYVFLFKAENSPGYSDIEKLSVKDGRFSAEIYTEDTLWQNGHGDTRSPGTGYRSDGFPSAAAGAAAAARRAPHSLRAGNRPLSSPPHRTGAVAPSPLAAEAHAFSPLPVLQEHPHQNQLPILWNPPLERYSQGGLQLVARVRHGRQTQKKLNLTQNQCYGN